MCTSVKKTNDLMYALFNITSDYDFVANEDGLMNRTLYLTTREARVDAFKKNLLINSYNAVSNNSDLRTTPFKTHIWIYRVLWRIISLNESASKLYRILFERASWVILVLIGSLLISLKDDLNKMFDGDPDTEAVFREWFGNLLMIIALSVILNIISVLDITYQRNKPIKNRLRRQRFIQIEDAMFAIDPYAQSYTWEYNSDDDDPDVAITVFRNTCPKKHGRFGNFIHFMASIFAKPQSLKYVVQEVKPEICKCNDQEQVEPEYIGQKQVKPEMCKCISQEQVKQ